MKVLKLHNSVDSPLINRGRPHIHHAHCVAVPPLYIYGGPWSFLTQLFISTLGRRLHVLVRRWVKVHDQQACYPQEDKNKAIGYMYTLPDIIQLLIS